MAVTWPASVFAADRIWRRSTEGTPPPSRSRTSTPPRARRHPHVTPVGFTYNTDLGTIDVGGLDLTATKKFRDVQRGGRAAIVIDDLASVDPWRPRGVEVRGAAEAITSPTPLIRIHPARVVSWGLRS